MKTLLYYFIQVVICSGIFYGYYYFFLRNKKFHQYNRYYLLGSVLGSISIPFLNIPVYFSSTQENHDAILRALIVITSSANAEPIRHAAQDAKANYFTGENMVKLFYLAVTSIVFIRALLSLLQIKRIINKYVVERIDDLYFVNTHEPGTPFSFFRWLFWDQKIELNSDEGQQIFRHELYHIQQRHSWDIVFFEIISIIFWLNPFFLLMKREIKTIHEFLADDFAAKENGKWNYAELLLMQVLQSHSHRLINPFFHNQIKRRIAMISLSKKPGHQYLRKLMVLPIALLALGIFAFSYKQTKTRLPANTRTAPHEATNPQPSGTTVQITNPTFNEPPAKRTPTLNLLNKWMDGRQYSIWIDNNRVENARLRNYSPGDFSYYSVTKLEKTAAGYSLEVNLVTNNHFASFISQKHFADIKTAQINIKADTLPKKVIPSDVVGVIDGKIIRDSFNTVLGKMDPQTIESISVLKGPAAVTKYGKMAVNGAIEITSKKPNQHAAGDSSNSSNPANQGIMVVGQSDDKVFTRVEVPPSFQDGMEAWREFIRENLTPDAIRKNNAPAGSYTVWIEFVIDKTGQVTSVKAMSNYGYGMEQECLQAIQQSPKWEPAKQNNHVVSYVQFQPVTFIVGDGKKVFNTAPANASSQNLLKEITVDTN